MEKLRNILTLVNTILLLVCWYFLYQRYSHSGGTKILPIANTHTEKVIVYDSTKKTMLSHYGPVLTGTIGVPEPFPVFIPVDTFEIVRQWLSVRTYSQVFQDSLIRIEIFDTISKNMITGRFINRQFLKPIFSSTSTTITPSQKMKVAIGLFLDGNKNGISTGPRLGIETKQGTEFTYDFDPLNRRSRIGITQQIKW